MKRTPNRCNKKSVDEIDDLITEAISELHEDEMRKAYSEMEDDTVELSPEFHIRMEQLEGRLRRKYVMRKGLRLVLGTAACLACILFLARPDYAVNASKSFFTWFEDHVLIEFKAKNKTEESKEVRYLMTYLPDGYTMMDSDFGDGNGFAFYVNSQSECISFYYSNNDSSIYVDSEDATCEQIVAEDGRVIYSFRATDDAQGECIIWKSLDGLTVFTINLDADFDKDKLMKIIMGVCEDKKYFDE